MSQDQIDRELSIVRYGKRMRVVLPSSGVPYVLEPLLREQYYEEPFLRYVRSLRVRGTYVDIGAHLGTHTLWFAMQCNAVHVHAFEPVGRFADVLRRNVELNGTSHRVSVHQIGLSNTSGRAENLLSASHQEGFDAHPSEQREVFPVQRLDEAVTEPVALMKLDVEGMEPLVLEGAERILHQDGPIVFAEARVDEEQRAIATALSEHGYVPTGRVFNATPTFEFRRPRSRRERTAWALRRGLAR